MIGRTWNPESVEIENVMGIASRPSPNAATYVIGALGSAPFTWPRTDIALLLRLIGRVLNPRLHARDSRPKKYQMILWRRESPFAQRITATAGERWS